MPSVLGKRKARAPAPERSEAELEAAQALFRKHFEAKFDPLPEAAPVRAEQENEEDLRSESSDDSEWDGLSGDEDDDDGEGETVEVIDHTTAPTTSLPPAAMMTKREMRAYLSSRPPDSTTDASSSSATSKTKKASGGAAAGPDDDDDAQNEDSAQLLANDLALQRLISESHILGAANAFSSTSGYEASDAAAKQKATFAAGRVRARTTDLRLQKLGSKESIFAQKSMPMGMRRGIQAAGAAREARRRREAKENGIILEREAPGKGAKYKRKSGQPNVDMPGMGKMMGAELRLSKREVHAVEMEGRPREQGKKRRRRR